MCPQKYTFDQRREWCEAYLKGEYVPTPLGARRPTFIRELRDWARRYREGGPDALQSMRRRKPHAEEETGGGAPGEDQGIREEIAKVRAGECLSKKLEVLGRIAGVEPRNAEKAEAVRQTRAQFPKAELKELLPMAKLPKSTYLYRIKHPDKDAKNAELMLRIKEIFDGSRKRYGVRSVAASLRSEETAISNAKVNRLMRKMGLRPRIPKRHYKAYKGGEGKAPQLLLVEYVRKDGTQCH